LSVEYINYVLQLIETGKFALNLTQFTCSSSSKFLC